MFYNYYANNLQQVELDFSDWGLKNDYDGMTLYNDDTSEELGVYGGLDMAPFSLGPFKQSVRVVFDTNENGQENGFLFSYRYTGMSLQTIWSRELLIVVNSTGSPAYLILQETASLAWQFNIKQACRLVYKLHQELDRFTGCILLNTSFQSPWNISPPG